MKTQCSHVLLWVKDIHQAVRDFRELGFTVNYATEEKKAQHAHIWFEQGAIIELLTSPKNARYFKWMIDIFAGRGAGKRMIRWSEEGEGFCDVALISSEFDNDLASLNQAGIKTGRVVPWKRTKPNGDQVSFRFVYPRSDRLPFLVSPYEPSQYPPKVEHANGATGIAKVELQVSEQDWHQVQQLINNDAVFSVTKGAITKIKAVKLDGLNTSLDKSLLHGGVIMPVS